MTDSTSLDRALVEDTRNTLARLLEAVRDGRLTAPRGMVARLEGAVWSLSLVLGDAVDGSAVITTPNDLLL